MLQESKVQERIDLLNELQAFMVNEVQPHVKEYDKSGKFPAPLFEKAFAKGYHCLAIPKEYGGRGVDHTTFTMCLETMARTDAGFAETMLGSSVGTMCVLNAGTEEQKRRACESIIPGGLAAFCLTEPHCGTDSVALRTSYRIEGDTIILNGAKAFVQSASVAKFYIVLATKDPALRSKGITAFMVERNTPGMTIQEQDDLMGLRLATTNTITFEEARIPLSAMLGNEGEGMRTALGGLDVGRVYNASVSTGICWAAMEEAVKYAKVRESMGKPLAKHQAIQMILGDMAIRAEAARQLVRNGAALLDNGENATKEAAIAKTFCGDAAVAITTDAVQILGGYGYTKNGPVEKLMRDAKIFQIFEGSNQILRTVISRELTK